LTTPAVVLLDHLVDEHLRAVEDAVQVDRQHLAPGRVVHLDEGLVRADSGVVDENVEVAELLEEVLRHAEGIGVVADVGLSQARLAAHLPDLLGHRLGGGLAGHEVHRDVGALLGERQRDRASDPTGAPGHERRTPFELHARNLPPAWAASLARRLRRGS